ATGSRRGAEDASGGVRAAVRIRLIRGSAHGHENARADVITEYDGAQEMRSGDCVLFRGCERCWNRWRTGVGARGAMRVVGFVGVRENSVDQRSVDRTG